MDPQPAEGARETKVITHSLTTTHTVRLVLALVSFGIAMIVASHLHVAKGSPFIGRVLLVLFSFSITLAQVAHWDEFLKWNTIFTAVTLAVGLLYCGVMVVEVRKRRRDAYHGTHHEH